MFLLTTLLSGGSMATTRPQLDVPVDCDLNTTCFIEQYFDHDPGPGRRDYRCGTLLGDGHDGIDFRVRQGGRDVPVVAAAAGVVLRVRDTMPDQSVRAEGGRVPEARMAGNGVVIDHGGFETQYSHLKLGSISVTPGEHVRAGQRVGTVGMSGNTEYLHVHFSVRVDGVPVDPFTGTSGLGDCTAIPPGSMWEATARRRLIYQPSGVADGGFSAVAPSVVAARAGTLAPIGNDPSALVIWADSFGTQAGDEEHFEIRAPSGDVILDRRQPIPEAKLTWFSFAGVRRPNGGWKDGTYTGEFMLNRAGRPIGSIKIHVILGSH